MSFSLTKILKGISIFKEGVLNPSKVEIIPGGTDGTKTTIEGGQTADRILTLPDNSGTILSTSSTIDMDQLETLTANRAVVTDASGKLTQSVVTDTELAHVSGVTSDIQTQINTVSTGLATEISDRTTADALKANLTLNNILPTTSVNMNAQTISNVADPVNPQDVATKNYVNSAGTGANTTLSNLTAPTAVNEDLLFNTTFGATAKTINKSGITNDMTISTGDSSTNNSGTTTISSGSASNSSGMVTLASGIGAQTGNATVKSGDGTNYSGNVSIYSGTAGVNQSGSVYIQTGAANGAGAAISGDIVLQTGTGALGRGNVTIDATELDMSGTKIINVATPISNNDAATKAYVDSRVDGAIKIFRINQSNSLFGSFTNVIYFNNVTQNDFGGTPYNVGTGSFTAPLTGKYQVLVTLAKNGSGTLTTSQALTVGVTTSGGINLSHTVFGNGTTVPISAQLSDAFTMTAGQYLTVTGTCDVSVNSSASISKLTIIYLGA